MVNKNVPVAASAMFPSVLQLCRITAESSSETPKNVGSASRSTIYNFVQLFAVFLQRDLTG